MITASELAAALLAGPGFTYAVRITSILGSEVLADDIPVIAASERGMLASNVPELVTLTVPRVDTSGRNWDPDGDDTHPLAAAGQKLAVVCLVNDEPVQRGVFNIIESTPNGDYVEVMAAGLLSLVQEARLLVPFVPSGTLKSTLRGLIEPAVTVNFDEGLADRSVPAGLNVDDDRLDAVYALLDAWPAEVTVDQTGVANVTRPKSTPGLWLPGVGGSYASTPDAAALDITGDIDFAIDVTAYKWSTGDTQALIAKWADATGDESYLFGISSTGGIILATSPTGVSGDVRVHTSTVPVGAADGTRLALRATLDVNDGAGNRVANFYTGASVDGPWTQLGSTVTTAGTTTIHSGALGLDIGGQTAGTLSVPVAIVHKARLRSGIGGTLVASVDFDTQPDTVGTSVVGDDGRTYTIHGSAYIVPVLTAVATLTEGDGGTVVKAKGKSSRTGVYTAVVARGRDSAGTPLSAVAYRQDAKGYPGNFNGLPVPYPLESDLLTTAGHCQAAASAKMAQIVRQTSRTLTVEAIPDPRIQLGDVLQLNSDTYTGLVMVIEIDLPLKASASMAPMRLTVVTIDG